MDGLEKMHISTNKKQKSSRNIAMESIRIFFTSTKITADYAVINF